MSPTHVSLEMKDVIFFIYFFDIIIKWVIEELLVRLVVQYILGP